jgi:NAD(P)-dependent dehydrogenase (short-subunit alcohol dehydrogenase family)
LSYNLMVSLASRAGPSLKIDVGKEITRVKVLVIGASGLVGGAAADALRAEGCEVLGGSRSSDLAVDETNPASIAELFERVGSIDAVVSGVGSVPFKPLTELAREDFVSGYYGKVQAQVDVMKIDIPYATDAGSFTLTSGILAREPIVTGVAASLVNGAVEAFVMAAAAVLPRGLRINSGCRGG